MVQVRAEHEVMELLERTNKAVNANLKAFPNLSYEEGIIAAILWLTSSFAPHPYEDLKS